jgi:1-acyl-sn-glycerol-3-phosphate acyltransferase
MNWEFALLPFIGWNLRMTGISIDRADPVNAKAGADAVVHAMREQGHSFFMSVEGRRSEDGGLQPFKHGAAVMAIRAGATIVPVITHGVREALPFGDWRVRAGSRVRVVYERAIPTVGLTLADRHRLTQQLWNIAVRELTPPGMQVPEHLRLAQRPKLSSSSSSSRGKSGATKESPSQQQQSTLQLPSAL